MAMETSAPHPHEDPAEGPTSRKQTAPAAAYEPPALVFLGRLKDLTAVGSFPDPT